MAEIIAEQEYDFVSEEHKDAEPATRMVFFAEDITPLFYGWDAGDVRDPKSSEYAIRQYDFEYNTCPVVAASFPEFVNDYILQDKGNLWKQLEEDPKESFSPDTRKKSARPRAVPRPPPSKPAAKPKKPSPVEERAHLLAVAANPGDPAPQLAYADWLDASDNALGELIRLRLGPEADLGQREAGLIAGLGKDWDKKLVGIGLLPAVLKRLGAKVVADDRREIILIDVEGDLVSLRLLEAFASYPALRELTINGHELGPAEVEAIARLDSVRDLHLHSTSIVDDSFRPLGRMADLESLCIGGHRATGEGLAHLRALSKLGSLTLGGRNSGDKRMAPDCLGHLEALPALKQLSLHNNGFGGRALAPLGRLHRLDSLDFGANPVTDDDLDHISGLVNLTFLGLERTEITGAGLVHLEALGHLEILRIEGRPIGDVGLASLGKLANLRELDFSSRHDEARITDEGCAHLEGLARLVELDLGSQELTDEALASFAGMTGLEKLDLSYNEGIVGPGLAHLRGLSRLKDLDLSVTGVTDEAIPHLMVLTSLESLDLDSTEVTAAAKEALRQALPGTRIR